MKSGTSPEMSGVLQNDEKDSSKREVLGRFSIWSNESQNEKAPNFIGYLEIPGKGKFRVAIWKNRKEVKVEVAPSIFDGITIKGVTIQIESKPRVNRNRASNPNDANLSGCRN